MKGTDMSQDPQTSDATDREDDLTSVVGGKPVGFFHGGRAYQTVDPDPMGHIKGHLDVADSDASQGSLSDEASHLRSALDDETRLDNFIDPARPDVEVMADLGLAQQQLGSAEDDLAHPEDSLSAVTASKLDSARQAETDAAAQLDKYDFTAVDRDQVFE